MEIALGQADYLRNVAKEARIRTRNRYYEANPVLTGQSHAALISRPGMRSSLPVGDGPVRSTYSQPGTFNDCLFVVSGSELYRVDKDLTVTRIATGLLGGITPVSMAAAGNIGDTPEMLFFADGRNLRLYMAEGYASGTLAGTPAANDVVNIGGVYYAFTAGSVDAGTPAGTQASPWRVALGTDAETAFASLFYAINGNGGAGSDYSSELSANPVAQQLFKSATEIQVRANATGTGGDDVAVSTTGAALAWDHDHLQGGGQPSVVPVPLPDDVGAISVGYCSSYVVVIPAQGAGINGRFYWIEPGETTIDALDFATAERAPDPVYNVIVFGDQFWLPGSTTTEVWYFTGTQASPVARLQGVTFDRGTWGGTAVQVKESMILVDSDGGVFQVSGGLQRISTPDIEERIREAIQVQAVRLNL